MSNLSPCDCFLQLFRCVERTGFFLLQKILLMLKLFRFRLNLRRQAKCILTLLFQELHKSEVLYSEAWPCAIIMNVSFHMYRPCSACYSDLRVHSNTLHDLRAPERVSTHLVRTFCTLIGLICSSVKCVVPARLFLCLGVLGPAHAWLQSKYCPNYPFEQPSV